MKIVKEILNLNKDIQKQRGLGLKILPPNQMLSRLPISFAELNTGNDSEKMKFDNYCILCTDKKKLTKNVYKSLVAIVRL